MREVYAAAMAAAEAAIVELMARRAGTAALVVQIPAPPMALPDFPLPAAWRVGETLVCAVFLKPSRAASCWCRKDEPEQQRARSSSSWAAQAQPPVPAAVPQLPYFPYAQRGSRGGGRGAGSGSSSGKGKVVCAICLGHLRHGELCSEVLVCHHVFHRDCIGLWMKSSNTCPLCRVEITPGPGGAPVADMV
ncbi:hypothetical protein E2562_030485 [Oryza meyeriana var. granulata]|uniref:RING-type E3 ubiquitin transferase n=1 Tax=Oryza meyeriana var. granulata TaxID=110450 RepID=A0A6G1CUZ7_9ORYZ|nr:hypothetical protein E2562_030485 [Oryza meyeriana var. granulata]